MKTATFHPVTITSETIGVLRQQDDFADLLALYVAYADVVQWQGTKTVRASTSFMMKRMGWGKDKLRDRKTVLCGLGLIKDVVKRDDNGKISGHFVQIEYVITPVENHTTENQTGGETSRQSTRKNSKSAENNIPPTEGEKSQIESSSNSSSGELHPPAADAPPMPPAPPTVASLYYQVIRQYELPVTNHNHVKKWAAELEKQNRFAIPYLERLLERDLREEAKTQEMVPTLNTAFDIIQKSTMIMRYYTRTKKNIDPRSYQ